MSDIFISYASEDRDRVQSLARALERKGWSVWWDRRIPIGRSFDEVIQEALDASKTVVVVWTKTSVKSSWVRNEARKGLRRRVLFPVMLLEEVEPPLEFEHVQAAQLMDWHPEVTHFGFDQFVQDIAQVIGLPSDTGVQQPPVKQPPEQPPSQPNPELAMEPVTPPAQPQRYILIGVGLLLAMGALVAYWIWSQGSSPGPSIVKSDGPAAPATVEPPRTQSTVTTPPPAPAPSEKPPPNTAQKTPTVTPVPTDVRTTATKPRPIAGSAKNNTGKNGAPMVLVPAGEFMMGSREDDKNASNDERPAHLVYQEDFYIDQYEVTTSRYATFFQEKKRQPPENWSEQVLKEHGRKPVVVGVNWNDADDYCAWAGKRLPTEAEWEKAARGTDQRRYPWGNAAPSETLANFGHCCDFENYGSLTDVGSFEGGKSPYGAYDMAGNVWEWVADWYDGNYYGKRPERNPTGPSRGEYRVLRGGSWGIGPDNVRSANRDWTSPTVRNATFGFRCAQDRPN